MRLILPLAFVAFALPAAAQEAEDAAAIQAVISDQLSDFNARDVAGAWAHASPMIQGMFGSPGNFGTMVENGYPMVWTNAHAKFLELREEGGALRQKVLVDDSKGQGWLLDYEMIEVDGAWLINGVQVLPAPDLAA